MGRIDVQFSLQLAADWRQTPAVNTAAQLRHVYLNPLDGDFLIDGKILDNLAKDIFQHPMRSLVFLSDALRLDRLGITHS
jgi:hypothetical protein